MHAAGERLADGAVWPAEPLAALADAGGDALAALLGAVVTNSYARYLNDYLFPKKIRCESVHLHSRQSQ